MRGTNVEKKRETEVPLLSPKLSKAFYRIKSSKELLRSLYDNKYLLHTFSFIPEMWYDFWGWG
jgi:hypothetical protein